jgi:hypothetical protein
MQTSISAFMNTRRPKQPTKISYKIIIIPPHTLHETHKHLLGHAKASPKLIWRKSCIVSYVVFV